jgi:general secretion pathway protein B
MSVILEALKRLDREKASRRGGAANIASEILKPDLPRPEKGVQVPFVAILLAVVATVGLTYGVAKLGFVSKSSPPASLAPPASSRQAALPPPDSGVLPKSPASVAAGFPPVSQQAAPAAPPTSGILQKLSTPAPVIPPAPSQQATPASVSQEPAVDEARDEMSRVPPKIETPAEIKNPATSQGEKETDKVAPEKAKGVPEDRKPSAEAAPVRPDTTPSLLRVSAIVWHEDPAKRVAMINGMIANEGSVIEGMRVEEIHPTRVRLSGNGRTFEISLR